MVTVECLSESPQDFSFSLTEYKFFLSPFIIIFFFSAAAAAVVVVVVVLPLLVSLFQLAPTEFFLLLCYSYMYFKTWLKGSITGCMALYPQESISICELYCIYTVVRFLLSLIITV